MTTPSLFPFRPIEFVVVRAGECCPFCGENRVTDDIHNTLTFLCGASGSFGGKVVETPCEGGRWQRFYHPEDAECPV